MDVGFLTTPLRTRPLSELVPWAASIGAGALEIDVRPGSHLGPEASDEILEGVRDLLAAHGLRVSSLACYVLLTGVPEEAAERNRKSLAGAIELAARLGVNTVGTLAGFPAAGKGRARTITEDLPGALRPVLDSAAERGVRLALENWYATNLQHLDHFRAVFDVLPDAHLGLNFDPSHLDWQGIDPLPAVREFRERLFHVHAKDVSVDTARLARVGTQGEGWWRYVLPGYGRIRWGEFIGALRLAGYDNVLSVEHEDAAYGPEEGFTRAVRYLRGLV